jgi:uncharacterized repeat protein (TIGR03803 family)
MKRSNHFSQAVLGKVSLGRLSRAFCTLLLIAGVVAPGAAQSIYVDNGTGSSSYIAEYSPNGATINANLLSFGSGNTSLHGLAYWAGNLYVPLDNGFASNSTVDMYNANTLLQSPTFNFPGNIQPAGIAVTENLLFVIGNGSGVSLYNATTGAAINALLATINYPQYVAARPDGQGNVVVYVTSCDVNGAPNSGSIQKLTVSSAGALVSGPTTLVANLNYPEGIALSANGQTAYVVIPSTDSNPAVGEVDAYDTTTGNGEALIANMAGLPTDIARSGPDLLVTLNTAFAVGDYNLTNQTYNPTFITAGISHPTGITVGPWVFDLDDFQFIARPCGALLAGVKVAAFYGTTSQGGVNNAGTVFSMTASGKTRLLHSFGTTDGANPYAGLTQGSNGEFYGTTLKGGAQQLGTVFAMSSTGALKTLHSFNGNDGANPLAGLVRGSNGNFYGTTLKGGSSNAGTVFEITPSGGLSTLHSFSGMDGASPYAALVQSVNGNLYGITYEGGTNNGGTVFEISSSGALTTLYNFCSQSNCSDGTSPVAGLVQGTDGNFYGTTYAGGTNNGGTVFQISPSGTLTTLYSLCTQGGSSCVDGQYPSAALVQGNDGNFYGTTSAGGAKGLGTIFNISPSGTLTTFYTFDGTAGSNPQAALMQYFDGTFYGAAAAGGRKNGGTIFNLSAGLVSFVETLPGSGKTGTPVKILGTGLTGTTSVTFNGSPAKFKVVSNFEITTTVPNGATTGPVQVVTPNGTFSSNVPFQVTK